MVLLVQVKTPRESKPRNNPWGITPGDEAAASSPGKFELVNLPFCWLQHIFIVHLKEALMMLHKLSLPQQEANNSLQPTGEETMARPLFGQARAIKQCFLAIGQQQLCPKLLMSTSPTHAADVSWGTGPTQKLQQFVKEFKEEL